MDELLEKYRKGQLSEEERQRLEQDLEKFKAYYDYTVETDLETDPLSLVSQGEFDAEDQKEARSLKKQIRKRWVKTAGLIGLVVLAITGISIWAVPKAMDAYYFNPTKSQYVKGLSDYQLYRIVENHVQSGQDPLQGIQVVKTGTAKYQVFSSFYNVFNSQLYTANIGIDKGEIVSTQTAGENKLSGSAFTFAQDVEHKDDSTKKLMANLEKLPDSAWIQTTLGFKAAKTLAQLQAYLKQYPDLKPAAARIWTKTPGFLESLFEVKFHGQSAFSNAGDWVAGKNDIQEKYPLLLESREITLASDEQTIMTFLDSNFNYLIDHQSDNFDGQQANKQIEQERQQLQDSSQAEGFIYPDTTKKAKENLAWLKEAGLKFDSFTFALPKETMIQIINGLKDGYFKIEDVSLMDFSGTAVIDPAMPIE